MKDYCEMSDAEIAMRVACSIDGVEVDGNGVPKFAVDCYQRSSDKSIKWLHVGDDEWVYFNPCNNPSDAWHTMDEYKIGLAFVNGEWRASSVLAGYHEFSDKSALRAAMIVYLMIKDEE